VFDDASADQLGLSREVQEVIDEHVAYDGEIRVDFREKNAAEILRLYSKNVSIKKSDTLVADAKNALPGILHDDNLLNPDEDEESDSYDILFVDEDVAVELKNINTGDYYNSMVDGRLLEEILRMTRTHKHSLVLIYGDIDKFVEDTFDRRRKINVFIPTKTKNTIYNQIYGFADTCSALNNLDNFMFIKSLPDTIRYVVKYAITMKNAEKIVNKKFVLRRPDIPKNHIDKVNIIRCIKNMELNRAMKVDKIATLHEMVNLSKFSIDTLVEKCNIEQTFVEDFVLDNLICEGTSDIVAKYKKMEEVDIKEMLLEIVDNKRTVVKKRLMEVDGIGNKLSDNILDALEV